MPVQLEWELFGGAGNLPADSGARRAWSGRQSLHLQPLVPVRLERQARVSSGERILRAGGRHLCEGDYCEGADAAEEAVYGIQLEMRTIPVVPRCRTSRVMRPTVLLTRTHDFGAGPRLDTPRPTPEALRPAGA